MEPTPTAAIMKAAIGDKHGHQKYLNRHTHCHRLWSRALEVRHDGSLAWKWSETNVFVNRTGRAHMRGIWADLENEVAIRRNARGEPPEDQYVSSSHVRELRMHLPPADFRAADVPHETFVDTLGWARLNRSFDGGFLLVWGNDATRTASLLDRMWHFTQRLHDECRQVLS